MDRSFLPGRAGGARGAALALVLAALLICVPAAGAATLTPSVVSSTAPAPMPASFTTVGDAIPPGGTILQLTFPTLPTAKDIFFATCPSGSTATAWGQSIALDSHDGSPGREAFSFMNFGTALSQTTYVLCQPLATYKVKMLSKTARSPAAFSGRGLTIAQGAKAPKSLAPIRFSMVSVSGLQPNVPMAVVACSIAYSPYTVAPVSGFTTSQTTGLILITATGTATSATFPVACMSNDN